MTASSHARQAARCAPVRARAEALLAAACLAVVPAGCGPQFGAFLYWTGLYPKPTVKAEFTLTKGPILILVDDDYNLTESQAMRDAIASALAEQLAVHKVNRRSIPLERLKRIRLTAPDYAKISAHELGRMVQAEQVLWIKIVEYKIGDLEADNPNEAARVIVSLRVLNCRAERRDDVRLWPSGREPHRLEITKPLGDVQRLGRDKVELLLIQELADRIAKLFYDYKVEPE
jgi:hypothetical protein